MIRVPAGSRAAGFAGRAGDLVDAIGLNYAGMDKKGRRLPSQRRMRLPDRR